MFVELENTVEGLIRFDDLGDDYFIYDENELSYGDILNNTEQELIFTYYKDNMAIEERQGGQAATVGCIPAVLYDRYSHCPLSEPDTYSAS